MVAEQVPLHSRILLRVEPVTTHGIAVAAILTARLDSILQVQKNPMIGWKL